MRVPDDDIVFDDLVRGEVRFAAEHVPDYVLVRANGEPLYTLVNPVDDALMEITHVLRGEDLLPSTPRQIVLYEALASIGVGSGRTPVFGHLPTVLGEGNRRLSKRDKGSGLAEYREQGYLPEGLLNYLALLGWSIADDRDVFTLAEMVEAFDILRVNANPARFDPRKCEAINASHIRLLGTAELTAAAGAVPGRLPDLLADPPTPGQQDAARRPRRRWSRNASTPCPRSCRLLGFLFLADDDLEIDPAAGLTAPACRPWRRPRGPGRPGDLRPHRRRGRPARRPRGGPRAEAAARLRTGPDRHHRAQDLAAAVRVDGAARPRVVAWPGSTPRAPRWRPEGGEDPAAPVGLSRPAGSSAVPAADRADPAVRRLACRSQRTAAGPSVARPAASAPPSRPAARDLVQPPDGVAYPLILRGPTYAWWRSVLGALFGLSLFFLLTSVVSQAVVCVGWALDRRGRPTGPTPRRRSRSSDPIGLLAANLGHRWR